MALHTWKKQKPRDKKKTKNKDKLRTKAKMYKIKQKPEDFIVKEINECPNEQGAYTYFILQKKNMTTIEALQKIAKAMHAPLRSFGYAGNKDKHAITQQMCSVKNATNIPRIEGLGITIIGTAKRPVGLGQHHGNHFTITVRNIKEKPDIKPEFINYYGEQRFGKENATIGKLIILGKLDEAAEKLGITKSILKQRPLKILQIYVGAYQASLWNKLAMNSTEEEIPMIGFGTTETPEVKRILDEERITLRNFVVDEMPHLSAEGQMRKRTTKAQELIVGELEKDEINTGMKKIKIEFTLEPGSYATEFIRQNFD